MLAEPNPFLLQPFLEALRVGNEEPRQQVATVECEPIVLERRGIAPEPFGIETDFLIAPADQDVVTKLVAKEMDGAVE